MKRRGANLRKIPAPTAFLTVILAYCGVLSQGHAQPVRNAENRSVAPYNYEAAILNLSTAPSVVLITVIDDTTGKKLTGCTVANFLVGAIMLEKGNRDPIAARDIALANADHIFHFSNPAALKNLEFGFAADDRFGNLETKIDFACTLIKQGKASFMTDRTGQVRAGQP